MSATMHGEQGLRGLDNLCESKSYIQHTSDQVVSSRIFGCRFDAAGEWSREGERLSSKMISYQMQAEACHFRILVDIIHCVDVCPFMEGFVES